MGHVDDESAAFAGSLLIRYTRQCDPEDALVRLWEGGEVRVFQAQPSEAAEQVEPL